MLYVLAFIVITLALLDRITRISRFEMVKYEFRFQLFAIRDELRKGLILGQIQRSNWFDYLDTTITKTIDSLPLLSIWDVLLLGYLHRNDRRLHNAQSRLETALSKDENLFLATIYKKILKCVLTFLLSRHFILVPMLRASTFFFNSINNLKSSQEKIAKIVTVAPETSTLTKFAYQ